MATQARSGFRIWRGKNPKTTVLQVGAAGTVVLAAGALWILAPRVSWHRSESAVVNMVQKGWHASLVSASYTTRGGARFTLYPKAGSLWPQTALPPGVGGRVTVTLAVPWPWRWIMGPSLTASIPVTTPAVPRLESPSVTWPLGSRLGLTFSSRVARVRVGTSKTTPDTLAASGALVKLGSPATTPGKNGVLWIRAQARAWEMPGPADRVAWHTVPYMAATAVVANGATIQPQGPFVVSFSQPVAHPRLSQWSVQPAMAGHWTRLSATRFEFVPSGWGTGPGGLVTITIPGGHTGPSARSGAYLQAAATLNWAIQPGSVLRLQQLLGELGYLPVSWAPSGAATTSLPGQQQEAYNPPAGTFTWKFPHLPSALSALWTPGQMNVITQGAIMQFERANGMAVDGVAGPAVWSQLISDRLSGKTNPYGYQYVYVTETLPETLELWINGNLTLSTLTNTGIPATPTALGTYPVYERLPFQIMRGKNPNGVPYADPVHWINYFSGGDAVHGFVRASYGFPQSLGCVEIPPAVANTVYSALHYGALVTVEPPGVPPAPAT
ncbi:MAG: L,D-transpeptidase [Thermaerobacter sp.]|nr:L,D-transpeptidase [Thermaerobacter sp.]